jgi:hypothetical protein
MMMAQAPNAPGSAHPYPRLYHNFALLLPDATVFNAGGQIQFIPNTSTPDPAYADPRFTGDVFRPPYLYYGFRPAIAGTQTDDWQFWNGNTNPTTWVAVGVQHTKCIDKFVLLRPAAITHNYDADQRYIELDWVYQDETQMCAGNETQPRFWVRPPTDDQGPIGYYMLFVIEKDDTVAPPLRAPSVARFIRMVG